MKMHVVNQDNDLSIEWINPNNRFGLWFDNIDAGWFYVDKDNNDDCNSLDRLMLELIYDKIGKILGK